MLRDLHLSTGGLVTTTDRASDAHMQVDAADRSVHRIGAWREYLDRHSPVDPIVIGALDVAHTALVVVDVQRKMADRSADPGASPRSSRVRNDRASAEQSEHWARIEGVVLPNISRLLARFRALSRAVLHFAAGPQLPRGEDLPLSYRLILQPGIDASGSTVHWASPEYDFVAAVRPRPDELVIRKRTRSGFVHTEAEGLLRSLGVTDLVVVGGATEACVESTARDAADCGFMVVVVEDAVIPSTPLNQDASLIAIACYFGAVRTTDDVLAELDEKG
jgi:nicotinamidase-related amidase